jgi:hypothetical protein
VDPHSEDCNAEEIGDRLRGDLIGDAVARHFPLKYLELFCRFYGPDSGEPVQLPCELFDTLALVRSKTLHLYRLRASPRAANS